MEATISKSDFYTHFGVDLKSHHTFPNRKKAEEFMRKAEWHLKRLEKELQ